MRESLFLPTLTFVLYAGIFVGRASAEHPIAFEPRLLTVDANEGQAGGGLQVRTADLDADGDLDIVVAGKDGTQILFNQRR